MIFNPFKKTESDEKFDRDESLIRVAALLVIVFPAPRPGHWPRFDLKSKKAAKPI